MKSVHFTLATISVLQVFLFFFLVFLVFRDAYGSMTGRDLAGETVLIVGIDSGGNSKAAVGGRTDYISIVYFGSSGKLLLKSIPRDTVISYGSEKRKINSLYNSFGMEALIKGVEELTEREITGWVVVDFSTVTELTRFTGPIRVEVNSLMHHDDFQQGLHIHFEPGIHFLEGEDLLKFLRYRQADSGDLGRIERQRQVVEQFLKNLVNAGPSKIVEMIDFLLEKTDISIDKKSLTDFAVGFFTGPRSVSFAQIDYYIDGEGRIIPTGPGSDDPEPTRGASSSPKILVVNNIPDYSTRFGDFAETIKAQWSAQAGVKIDATGLVPEINGIEKRGTYLFINTRATEIRELFSKAHVYHRPIVMVTSSFGGLDYYYGLIDSLSENRFYPSNYDAYVLLGVGGK
ncbi:MAG TPA: LCP family protein [Mesotoga sp.]|jgi:LCP family protein required for cell wall assembly|uniref:LCP family protein n=1 Tax=unclassified Mesotoga TaxID=1184398 RepID=UPI000DC035A1|nr:MULTISPECIES: LCP family protein [unclassified Mesotoga]RAM63639.1 transcriptional regulator [Mesotoga sp. SC_3PWM13N19]HNU23628.1 LCP family protein [Mesotoga sp.]